jgi:hypothetical protein
MAENLSQMVKEGSTNREPFLKSDIDVSSDSTTPEVVEQETLTKIPVTSLSSWFGANLQNFPNLRKPTVAIQGVNPNKQLIITIPHPTDPTDGKRKLIVYDDAHTIPVLDIPAIDMQIYGNGFRIVYQLTENLYIKSYGVRTGLVCVFCNDIDDMLIPYHIEKIKKKDTELEIPQSSEISTIRQSMQNQLDYEALQLRYSQSSKAEGLQTNLDAIKWLLEKQASIFDVNHHIQIDGVIIMTLS